MNSVAQVGIGILILGTAFVFGSQMKDKPSDAVNQETPANALGDFVWQKPAFEPKQAAATEEAFPTADLGNGLIDMPVAKKRVPASENGTSFPAIPTLPENSDFQNFASKPIPDSAEQEPTIAAMRKQIVEPDFSTLASSFFEQGAVNEPENNSDSLPRLEPEKLSHFPPGNGFVPVSSNIPTAKESFEETSPSSVSPTQFNRERWAEQEPARPYLIPPQENAPVRSVVDLPVRREVERVVQRVPITNIRKSEFTKPTNRDHFRPLSAPVNSYGMTEMAKSKMVEVGSRNSNGLRLETNKFVRHEAMPGESLQIVSRKYYGKPDFYLDIYLANQDVLKNPAHIPPGATLRIPVYE